MLKTNDTSVGKMRYVSNCSDVAFNFYDLGNLLYWTSFIHIQIQSALRFILIIKVN